MTYTISQTDVSALSTEELRSELVALGQLGAKMAERYSLVLSELRKRGQRHEFMQHTVLAFFKDIADQRLDPEAAVALSNRNQIKAIVPLPRKQQRELANDAPVQVAYRDAAGEVRVEDKPLRLMDGPTIKRAFGPDGIRPVHEQAEMIRAEGKITRHGAITVLKDEVALKIGNQKIRPEELKGPLLALGYTLDLTRNSGKNSA